MFLISGDAGNSGFVFFLITRMRGWPGSLRIITCEGSAVVLAFSSEPAGSVLTSPVTAGTPALAAAAWF